MQSKCINFHSSKLINYISLIDFLSKWNHEIQTYLFLLLFFLIFICILRCFCLENFLVLFCIHALSFTKMVKIWIMKFFELYFHNWILFWCVWTPNHVILHVQSWVLLVQMLSLMYAGYMHKNWFTLTHVPLDDPSINRSRVYR